MLCQQSSRVLMIVVLALCVPLWAAAATWDDLDQQAATLIDQQRYAEAVTAAEESLRTAERLFGNRHPAVAVSLETLALAQEGTGNLTMAKVLLLRALELRESVLGADHPSISFTLNRLAEIYQRLGHYTEVERLLRRALAIDQRAFGEESPEVVNDLCNLAVINHRLGVPAEAESLYRQALVRAEATFGPGHPELRAILEDYAVLLRERNRIREARGVEARLKTIPLN